MTQQRLFISHASEDAAAADRIVAYLEARNVTCWISSRDIPPRAIYADAIAAAMQDCSACAVLVSAASNQSKAVKRELELASHHDRPFIPIRLDATEPAAGVDYYLRNTQWMDYKRDGERALDRIAAQMQGASAAPSRPPPPRPSGGGRFLISGIAIATLVLLGLVGWYGWTRLNAGADAPVRSVVAAADLAPFAGNYSWEGLACGAGPAVTIENDALIFTTPDGPTYRHQALAVRKQDDGVLVASTRVLEPSDHAGETYSLGLDSTTGVLSVVVGESDNFWNKCPDSATPPNASQALSLADSLWWGEWGEGARVGWQLRADGVACMRFPQDPSAAACDRTWRQSGATLVIESEPEIWTGEVTGNTYAGSFGPKADPSRRTRFSLTRE